MARILLVEDDAEVGRLLEHVLVADRYEVDRAKTVADACSELDAPHPYDLVVADARLPDGTGMKVAECAVERGIRALIITGYGFAYPELRNYDYLDLLRKSGEFPVSNEELDDTATTVYEGI